MKTKLIQKLTEKILSENLQDKAETLENKLKNVEEDMGGMEDEHPIFGKMTPDDLEQHSKKLKKHTFKKHPSKKHEDDPEDEEFPDFIEAFEEETQEKEMCSECNGSGMMNEIECSECGGSGMKYSMEEGLYDVSDDFPKEQSFDYVEEESDIDDDQDEEQYQIGKDMPDEEACMYHRIKFGPTDDRTKKFCIGLNIPEIGFDEHMFSMNENLKGKQKKIDMNKNGKIDSEDFKLLRKKNKITKKQTEEGNAFTGKLSQTKKGGKFKLGNKTYTDTSNLDEKECNECGKRYDMSEKTKNKSLKLKESELIDLISLIVEKENKKTKNNIKSSGNPPGLKKYEQSHKASGKENSDYLKSLEKKMKEYLKDGSKGKFETNPDFFPKGNGELTKMNKKAYVPSDAVKDYTDNLTAAGLENLDYDEIHPNEKWVEDNVVGSSKTGNNPEWANTGKSDVNKKRNDIRKKNMLAKIKRKAYNKAPQPVLNDKTGEDEGSKLMMKLESQKVEKINEQFSRMQQLIEYNKNTQ
jgi:hypothetical protein